MDKIWENDSYFKTVWKRSVRMEAVGQFNCPWLESLNFETFSKINKKKLKENK